MDVPGGVVERPLDKLYRPTFWCASHFVHARDATGLGGLALLTDAPATVTARRLGTLEWMVLRNAHKERAFGLLPVPAHPAAGYNDEPHACDYGVRFTGPGDWRACGLPDDVAAFVAAVNDCCAPGDGVANPGGVVVTGGLATVLACKRAEDHHGVILRLQFHEEPSGPVRVERPGSVVVHAERCDALERSLGAARLLDGGVMLDGARGLVTLRVRFG